MGSADDVGEGTGGAMVALVLGLLVPVLFNSVTEEQDVVFSVVALAAFGACILYGETFISLPSGVAFGFGMLLTSFAARNPWLLGLAATAVVVNLVKYAREDAGEFRLEVGGSNTSFAGLG